MERLFIYDQYPAQYRELMAWHTELWVLFCLLLILHLLVCGYRHTDWSTRCWFTLVTKASCLFCFVLKTGPFTFLMRLLFYLICTLITDTLCQQVKFCFSKVKSMGTPQVSEWWSRSLFFASPFYWSQQSYI